MIVYLLLIGIVSLSMLAASAGALTISSDMIKGGGPLVSVAKTNRTELRGTITDCTAELLYVAPAPKPVPKLVRKDATPPPAASEPVPLQLPWQDIKSVSDGLNAHLALQIWMTQHNAELCPTCHGERTVWCPVCKGTKHDPAAATTCPLCKGELLVPCKTAREKDGEIPCPNSCLKRSEGNWVKQPDGLYWRAFRFGYATQTWSEHHVGDVMQTDTKNQPPITDLGKCPICGGTTLIADPICFGTGQVPCPTCLARAAAGPCPNHCDNGRVACPDCQGTGLKKS